jgi:hypothetical protein
MAVLVAGVAAANLALIYASIAVSILAAVTLAAGVLLRRRELFGETRAAPRRDQLGWAAPGAARPVPVRPAADDRVTADGGARREDTRRDGEQPDDLAARPRKAGPGVAADTGLARWPASIAAKGAPATARPDREHAASGRERGARDRAAAAKTDRARTPPGHDGQQGTPARRDRALAGRGEAAAGQQAEAFRLPPKGERARARAGEPGQAIPGAPAGGEPEEAGPAESRQPGPVPYAREAIPRPPGEKHDRGGQPPADEPDAVRAGATASSAWSAWSSARAGDQGTGADAGEPGRGPADHNAAHDERAVMQATAGGAAGRETGAAGEAGDRAAEAGGQGDAAVDETPDGAGAGAAVPGETEPPGADGPGETAGSTADAESEAEPGSAHDAADTSAAAGAGDAGAAGASGTAGGDAGGSAPPDDQVAVVPGVPRYHRRGCILIRFLSDGDLEISTRRAAEAAGLVPCKACQPDKPA